MTLPAAMWDMDTYLRLSATILVSQVINRQPMQPETSVILIYPAGCATAHGGLDMSSDDPEKNTGLGIGLWVQHLAAARKGLGVQITGNRT